MTAISEELSDERLERVLTSLPPNDRPDGYPRQTQVQVAWLRTVLTELLSLRSGNGGEVRVKALEWREEIGGTWWTADAYRVEVFDGGGFAARVSHPQSRAFRTIAHGVPFEEAKAAAQADYETRILSALDIKP